MNKAMREYRVRLALAMCGPGVPSVVLYDWIVDSWPCHPGFKSVRAVGMVRRRVQPGWRRVPGKGIWVPPVCD